MEDFIYDHIGKILIVVLIAFICLIPALGDAECKAKTEGMGFKYDWSFFGGCRIEYKPNKWIPLERYRAIDD